MKLKKFFVTGTCAALLGLCAIAATSCDGDVIYQANTRFLYSMNGGLNWSETIQEITVGNTYWLAIEMSVVQSAETKSEMTVRAEVTVPNTNVVDCYLDDHPGTSITGTPNPITGSTTYQFNLVAGTNPTKFRAVFECVPLLEGRASIYVVYDDKVSASWDATGAVKYVSKESSSTPTDDK